MITFIFTSFATALILLVIGGNRVFYPALQLERAALRIAGLDPACMQLMLRRRLGEPMWWFNELSLFLLRPFGGLLRLWLGERRVIVGAAFGRLRALHRLGVISEPSFAETVAALDWWWTFTRRRAAR